MTDAQNEHITNNDGPIPDDFHITQELKENWHYTSQKRRFRVRYNVSFTTDEGTSHLNLRARDVGWDLGCSDWFEFHFGLYTKWDARLDGIFALESLDLTRMQCSHAWGPYIQWGNNRLNREVVNEANWDSIRDRLRSLAEHDAKKLAKVSFGVDATITSDKDGVKGRMHQVKMAKAAERRKRLQRRECRRQYLVAHPGLPASPSWREAKLMI